MPVYFGQILDVKDNFFIHANRARLSHIMAHNQGNHFPAQRHEPVVVLDQVSRLMKENWHFRYYSLSGQNRPPARRSFKYPNWITVSLHMCFCFPGFFSPRAFFHGVHPASLCTCSSIRTDKVAVKHSLLDCVCVCVCVGERERVRDDVKQMFRAWKCLTGARACLTSRLAQLTCHTITCNYHVQLHSRLTFWDVCCNKWDI